MHCCPTSNCTSTTVKAWSYIGLGIAICSFIPLLIGCLGKYGHIPLDRAIYKGMILSGSLGSASVIVTAVVILICRRIPACSGLCGFTLPTLGDLREMAQE